MSFMGLFKGVSDEEMVRIAPNVIEMQRKYDGAMRYMSTAILDIAGGKFGYEAYNRMEVTAIAERAGEQLRRAVFSDILDVATVYRGGLTKKNMYKPLPRRELIGDRAADDLTKELVVKNDIISAGHPFNLEAHGEYLGEKLKITSICIDYAPEVKCYIKGIKHYYSAIEEEDRNNTTEEKPTIKVFASFSPDSGKEKPMLDPEFEDTNHPKISKDFPTKLPLHGPRRYEPLRSTPANLLYQVADLALTLLPMVKLTTAFYQNKYFESRLEKNILAANVLSDYILDSCPVLKRFTKIHHTLKENFMPTI